MHSAGDSSDRFMSKPPYDLARPSAMASLCRALVPTEPEGLAGSPANEDATAIAFDHAATLNTSVAHDSPRRLRSSRIDPGRGQRAALKQSLAVLAGDAISCRAHCRRLPRADRSSWSLLASTTRSRAASNRARRQPGLCHRTCSVTGRERRATALMPVSPEHGHSQLGTGLPPHTGAARCDFRLLRRRVTACQRRHCYRPASRRHSARHSATTRTRSRSHQVG